MSINNIIFPYIDIEAGYTKPLPPIPPKNLGKRIIQFTNELEQKLQIIPQLDSDRQKEKVEEIEDFLNREITEDALKQLSDDDLFEIQKNSYQMKDIEKKIQESNAWGVDDYYQTYLNAVIKEACEKIDAQIAMRAKYQARTRVFHDDSLRPSHNEKIHFFEALLRSTKLVVKTVSGIEEKALKEDVFGETTWNYLIEIFKDPQKKRDESRCRKEEIIKSVRQKFVTWVYNPETRSLDVKQKENFYKGSKATSVSLLPPSGQEKLFTGYARNNVAICFDLDKCEIKNRYVYRYDNAMSRPDNVMMKKTIEIVKYPLSIVDRAIVDRTIDTMLMIELEYIEKQRKNHAFESVDGLREHLQKEDEQNPYPIPHNEMLASLKKEGMAGIIAVIPEIGIHPVGEDTGLYKEIDITMVKLMAISRQKFVLDQLGIDLPIFLQNPKTGIFGFPQAEQNDLIEQVLHDANLKELVVAYMAEYFHNNLSTQEIEKRLVAYLNESYSDPSSRGV
ncbi:MAG: hypothetical protein HKM07_01260 [Chlamydiae bacterium]|nr:hypothetical protein [Chlamydiota bacterium]